MGTSYSFAYFFVCFQLAVLLYVDIDIPGS